jgi:hypothetical protein
MAGIDVAKQQQGPQRQSGKADKTARKRQGSNSGEINRPMACRQSCEVGQGNTRKATGQGATPRRTTRAKKTGRVFALPVRIRADCCGFSRRAD